MFKFHLPMIVYSTERIMGKSNAVGRHLHYTHVHHFIQNFLAKISSHISLSS